jgi:hypothetical protein
LGPKKIKPFMRMYATEHTLMMRFEVLGGEHQEYDLLGCRTVYFDK